MPKPNLRRLLRAALTHPVVLKLKSPLQNVWWSLRGRGTRNPPLPRDVQAILFVCLGNICRSPFGAELSKRLLAERGRPDIRCTSAGIRSSQDKRSPDEACQVSATYGLDLTGHRPQALTRDLMESHDLVVVMEWRHLAQLRAAYPEYYSRIFLLPLLDASVRTGYERFNVADPFGRPASAFEQCYDRMNTTVRQLIASICR